LDGEILKHCDAPDFHAVILPKKQQCRNRGGGNLKDDEKVE
jgi:hypothetical protein